VSRPGLCVAKKSWHIRLHGDVNDLLYALVDKDTTESVPQVDGINLMKLAQKLHMNTDIRKKILFAIVTSNVCFASSSMY